MYDALEQIGSGSLIQHGKLNDRIYLLKLSELDSSTIVNELSELALKNKYSKIFCKVPKHLAPLFFAKGFLLEANIPRFYKGIEDVFFVSKFLNSDRLLDIETNALETLSSLLKEEGKVENKKKLPKKYKIRKLHKDDVEQITAIYREVFESYPFPIHNPGYILKTMDENIHYFGVEKKGELVALASSEMDIEGRSAEMTDFATLPGHAGNNLAVSLLKAMEKEMRKKHITTLYTIARLNSIPMNKTFLKSDYKYSGTLIKNTNISGKIESMNVWYRHL